MTAAQWTIFWKSLGVKVVKRGRTLKNYRYRSDINSIVKIGVNRYTAERIHTKSLTYGDQLFFNRFSKLFKRDPKTIAQWLNCSNPTDAFEHLFKTIKIKNIKATRIKLNELDIIFRFNLKGEQRIYESA